LNAFNARISVNLNQTLGQPFVCLNLEGKAIATQRTDAPIIAYLKLVSWRALPQPVPRCRHRPARGGRVIES
jgi:hypothetical protein